MVAPGYQGMLTLSSTTLSPLSAEIGTKRTSSNAKSSANLRYSFLIS